MTWTSNPGRAVPYRLQQACFLRDNWTCQACGYTGRQHKGDLHADHIHNRATGGTDELPNLMTLCVPCHHAKTRQETQEGRERRQRRRPPRQHPSAMTRGDAPHPAPRAPRPA